MSADDAAGPTQGPFARLLARLGPDAERAGDAYEHLRRALTSFFAWRGAATPEECADETLDRLARRLDDGLVVEDMPRYARGIARHVLLEHWRRAEARNLPLEAVGSRPAAAPEPSVELRSTCLESCLGTLELEGRELILKYYLEEGRRRIEARKRIAQALSLSENALRSRAQRLRDRLERCLKGCLAAGGTGSGDTKS